MEDTSLLLPWQSNYYKCKWSIEYQIGAQLYSGKLQVRIHRIKLKRGAGNSRHNLREVYDKSTSSEPARAAVSYRHVRNTIVKRRKTILPTLPKTSEDFKEVIMQSRFVDFVRGSVLLPENEGTAVLFPEEGYSVACAQKFEKGMKYPTCRQVWVQL